MINFCQFRKRNRWVLVFIAACFMTACSALGIREINNDTKIFYRVMSDENSIEISVPTENQTTTATYIASQIKLVIGTKDRFGFKLPARYLKTCEIAGNQQQNVILSATVDGPGCTGSEHDKNNDAMKQVIFNLSQDFRILDDRPTFTSPVAGTTATHIKITYSYRHRLEDKPIDELSKMLKNNTAEYATLSELAGKERNKLKESNTFCSKLLIRKLDSERTIRPIKRMKALFHLACWFKTIGDPLAKEYFEKAVFKATEFDYERFKDLINLVDKQGFDAAEKNKLKTTMIELYTVKRTVLLERMVQLKNPDVDFTIKNKHDFMAYPVMRGAFSYAGLISKDIGKATILMPGARIGEVALKDVSILSKPQYVLLKKNAYVSREYFVDDEPESHAIESDSVCLLEGIVNHRLLKLKDGESTYYSYSDDVEVIQEEKKRKTFSRTYLTSLPFEVGSKTGPSNNKLIHCLPSNNSIIIIKERGQYYKVISDRKVGWIDKRSVEPFEKDLGEVVVPQEYLDPMEYHVKPLTVLPDYNNRGRSYHIPNPEADLYILTFWDSDCKPCIEEFPDMVKMLKSLADHKIRIYAATGDEADYIVTGIQRKLRLNFPVCYDAADSEYFKLRKKRQKETPYTLIIDKMGNILDEFTGKRQWNSYEWKRKLLGYLYLGGK